MHTTLIFDFEDYPASPRHHFSLITGRCARLTCIMPRFRRRSTIQHDAAIESPRHARRIRFILPRTEFSDELGLADYAAARRQ